MALLRGLRGGGLGAFALHPGARYERTGKALGLFAICIGPCGLLFAGWLADRLGQRGYRDAKIRVGLLAGFCSLPLAIFTDYIFKDPMLVNYSLLCAGLMANVFAIAMLIWCLRHYTGSLDRLKDWSAGASEAA